MSAAQFPRLCPVGPTDFSHCPFNESSLRWLLALSRNGRASACPYARPCARARAGSPAPRSRPSSRCPGGRRPLAPLLLPPPGRESAARGPGEGRGQPRAGPGSTPVHSHASRKVLSPCTQPSCREEGFLHSHCWPGLAPSVGWGFPYEGWWQPELIQPPWSGVRTPAEEGRSF